jgi:hypothetical protein
MKELVYTLLTDGSSDRALLPILTWLLREHGITYAIQAEWAELRQLRKPPRALPDRIKWSLALFPCDLLFVQRDAERIAWEIRLTEINRAIEEASMTITMPPTICVVPVRMQEAWLLFDEIALRQAAGNPHGRIPLDLPALNELETLPDPKDILHDCLRRASGLTGRRRKKFSVDTSALRIAEFMTDFSPLRTLFAFQELEREVIQVIQEQQWSD